MHQEEIELEILKSLGKVTSQRTIADEIGYSAGKVNYVLKKLVEKGLVKVDRFVNSKSKVQYKYLLTPEGRPPLHKGTKCDMRFKSSLNSARLNLLNPYK